MSISVERIKKLIQRRVAMVLLRDLNDPRVKMVTITRVTLNRDRSEGRIYWSTLEEGGTRRSIERGLNDAAGYVQAEVAKVLHTRTVPHLEFVFDKTIEGMERISKLINEGLEEDRKRAEERGEEDGEEGTPESDPRP